jgi:type IV secretion system protein VirD4
VRPQPPAAPPALESAALGVAGAAAGAAACFWLASELALAAGERRWVHLPVAGVASAMGRLPSHLSAPATAWPGGDGSLPATAAFYVALVAVAVLSGGLAWRLRPARRGRGAARWARSPDLRALGGRRRAGGRLVIGRAGRRLVATEARHSVLVMGPTQSGKTTGLAIPAILEWDGPVVATSVKDDLAARTIAWRRTVGPCAVFDPTMGSGLGGASLARWSPVDACTDWTAAQKMASWLVESTPGRRGMADAAFWYATAAKQLVKPGTRTVREYGSTDCAAAEI